MHALVTAGGIPVAGEHLYEQTRGIPKAMLDIQGRPMIQWVLDALDGCQGISDIFVVGLSENAGVKTRKPIHFIPDQGDALTNVMAGTRALVDFDPGMDTFLMTSSDIPALTTAMVDWVVAQTSLADVDLQYFTVRRQDMERRFPDSRRTYTRFKDAELCAADIFLIRAAKVLSPDARWRDLLSARKNPMKQAAIIGFDVLLLMLMRRIPLQDAVKIITRRLGLTGRVAFTPFPEMGMDVDKDFQLEIMRRELAGSRD